MQAEPGRGGRGDRDREGRRGPGARAGARRRHRAWIRRPAARCGPARCGRAVRAGAGPVVVGAGPARHGERDRAGDHAGPVRSGRGQGQAVAAQAGQELAAGGGQLRLVQGALVSPAMSASASTVVDAEDAPWRVRCRTCGAVAQARPGHGDRDERADQHQDAQRQAGRRPGAGHARSPRRRSGGGTRPCPAGPSSCLPGPQPGRRIGPVGRGHRGHQDRHRRDGQRQQRRPAQRDHHVHRRERRGGRPWSG